ncbi:putative glutathione-specific gamma-glutamylcyclotransferase 2 [Teleopsis dalmanni]|uniref:putative glutathione-specific gamma-glutamylcyclotransferase 2 n=1 Tax=Teleopsis dalmanni TaxID=139649 RepID=UPI0018CF202C|nr:putative glutathione-specific gamma-glutamylcyclotransferase 2 [Teleopsis dalmanni]
MHTTVTTTTATTKKLSLICNALLPELKSVVGGERGLNEEALIGHLYRKYFQQKVCCATISQKAGSVDFQRQLQLRTNLKEQITVNANDIWIFGYGSLIWKADFPYIDRRRGYISGYQRRFYQHSIDHRGTHTKPGRVVTLLPTADSNDRVYGVAYRIAAHMTVDVLSHLDYREQNGYERCTLSFQEFPEATGAQFDVIMYIATKDNVSYAGDVWQLTRIAEQIFTSAGPSGTNREYLFNLALAVRFMFPGVNDAHLFELEAEVLKLIQNVEVVTLEKALSREICDVLAQIDEIANDDEGNSALEMDNTIAEFQKLVEKCTATGWKEHLLAKKLGSR